MMSSRRHHSPPVHRPSSRSRPGLKPTGWRAAGAALALAVLLAQGEAPAQEVPPESSACVAVCGFLLEACHDAQGCGRGEWPRALSTPCQICNQRALFCTGSCMTKKTLEMSYEGCNPICGLPGVACGTPDGCGGTCDADEICAFLVRRPEFYPVLF